MNAKKLMALGSLMGTSLVFAAANDITQLDIVIRDFQPNHPDFENFSEESINHLNDIYNFRSTSGLAMSGQGYGDIWKGLVDLHRSCGNMNSNAGAKIGMDGKPMIENPYLPPYLRQTSATTQVLEYGECANKSAKGTTQRGYKQIMGDVKGFVCPNNNTVWQNPVYYTPGMVEMYLKFDDPVDGEYEMYDGVHIVRANQACDNMYFDQWYHDVPGQNLRTNTTMDIPRDASGYYVYDYNYNNGGYSPLDSINPTTGEWVGAKACDPTIQPRGVCEQYGAQSLSIFCPPYNYQYAKDQTDYRGQKTADLCSRWLYYGGPRNVDAGNGVSAAMNAAADYASLGKQHLRNYAFTMMGYAKFKYKAANQVPKPEVFEFAGDDDMWIYVDGVLAVDLGGTHLSAPGSVNIQTLATNNHGCHAGEPLSQYSNCEGASDATGWADGTWHHLHFFYADRQTDGSNIYIRSSLAEVAPSRYGQPAVNNVTVKMNEDGSQTTSLLLNTELSAETMAGLNNPLNPQPAILIMRSVSDGMGGTKTEVYGLYITEATFGGNKGASGMLYEMKGVLRDAAGNEVPGGINGSDKMAFNFPYNKDISTDDELKTAYSATSKGTLLWDELLQWNTKMTFAISGAKPVVGFPDAPANWAVVKFVGSNEVVVIPPDTNIERPDFNQKLDELKASAGDGKLDLDQTADLLFTEIPAGANPLMPKQEVVDQLSTANPPVGVTTKRTTLKAGSPSSDGGLCFEDPANPGVESCPSWSFPVAGPTLINVRVYDHLGHFVSQYQQRITEKMLQDALGANPENKTCVDNNDVMHPVYGDAGALLMTLKMYPISQEGRMVGTGLYLYQVTMIREEYSSCVVINGTPQWNVLDYERSATMYHIGYRRQKNK